MRLLTLLPLLCVAFSGKFSPDEVENALDARLSLAEENNGAPCDCQNGASLVQVGETKGRGLLRATAKGCDCDVTDAFKAPDVAADGEELYVDQCELERKDIDFWGIGNTKFNPKGIVLDYTVGYTDSCDSCAKHNLKCLQETQIEPGYCLCMWRTDGADPLQKMMPCGSCVKECIGKFVNFDLGKIAQPTQENGMCVRKKGYFR